MISGTVWSFLPLLLGLFGAQAGVVGQSVTRLIIQDEVIIRVPVQPRPLMPEIEWIEKKGPKCIPAAAIQRALLSGSEQVDFVLMNRARIRAQFDEDQGMVPQSFTPMPSPQIHLSRFGTSSRKR